MVVEFAWTEERASRLLSLYKNGMSFTEIANDLGCSRNAVIGRAHRSGFVPRAVKKPKPPPVVFAKARKPMPRAPKAGPVKDRDYSCTIWQLTDTRCRFPLWSHDSVSCDFYCGAPGAELSASRPYCVKHTRICNPTR